MEPPEAAPPGPLLRGGRGSLLQPHKKTVLHVACEEGHIDLVKHLLHRRERHVFEQDPDGFTPLHYAAKNGHLHICRLLLEEGASPNAASSEGLSSLHLLMHHAPNPELMQLLVAKVRAIRPTGPH